MSIGELAKASGISIRALRYYDKKGYLKPDYINPETNYRYYSSDQFSTLNILQMFSEFDIPLSEIEQLEIKDNYYNIEELIKKIEQQIQEKLAYYQTQQMRIDALKENIKRLNYLKSVNNKHSYQDFFLLRHVVIKEFTLENPSYFDFTEMTVNLYDIAIENELTSLFNRGIFKININGEEKRFGFLEVETTSFTEKQKQFVHSFPEGKYNCTLYKFDTFYSNINILWNEKLAPNTLLIFNGLYDIVHQSTASNIESQRLSF